MAFCESEYSDTIGSIQKSIHEREKRRHELEKELLTHSKSEERLAKLKCVKMHLYHKELCKREQQAKTRNLELLRNVESLVSNAKEFSLDYSVLHRLKVECRSHITRLLEEKRRRENERDLQAQNKNNVQGHSRSPFSSMGPSSQPAVIFMGRQTLKGTSVEDGVTSAHSPSLTEAIPNHPSAYSPQSSPLMDGHISKANRAAALSDDILNSDDFPRGNGDMRERRRPADCGFFAEAVEERGLEQLASPRLTLKASGVSSHRSTVKRPESRASLQPHPRQSPSPDTTRTRSPLPCNSSGEQAREAATGVKAHEKSAQKRTNIPDQSKSRSPSIPSSDVNVSPDPSLNTSSDVSVSLSESLHEQPSPRGGATMLERNCVPSLGSTKPKDEMDSGVPLPLEPEYRLSLEGFFFLLDSIEERLTARDTELYSSSSVSEQTLRDIISLCGQHGGLKRHALSACGAVVLHQLPFLSWKLPQGSLLPSELVNTQWSTALDPSQIRTCLSGDSAALWERWLTHVLRLLRQEVLTLDSVVQLFTPLLVSSHSSYTGKAEVLLKRILTHAAETNLTSESEESSSCGLPSLLNDGVEIRPARPSNKSCNTAGTQGVQSGEEDSTDQSPVESIPIRETKAYQLLKQSVTQEKQWRNIQEEEDASDLSGLSDTKQPENSEKLAEDLSKVPKSKDQAFSAVQSKAFWGDSDDTNSEIEKALRPQSRNTNSDDFDDFYD